MLLPDARAAIVTCQELSRAELAAVPARGLAEGVARHRL
jgi:hypothetical protein